MKDIICIAIALYGDRKDHLKITTITSSRDSWRQTGYRTAHVTKSGRGGV